MRRRLALVALVLAVPTVARAGGRPTLVVQFSGDAASTALAGQLTRAMGDAIGRAGGEALPPSSQDDVLALSGCASPEPSCLAGATAMLEIDRMVLGQVEASPDGAVVHLTLIAADGEIRRADVKLAGTGDASLTEAFAARADAFLAGRPADAATDPTAEVSPPPPDQAAAAVTTTAPDATVAGSPATSFSLARVEPWTWGVAGGGVALVGLSALMFGLAAGVQDEVDGAPTRTAAELDDLAELEDRGERYTRLGNLSLVVGGAAVAVGAYFAIRQGSRREAEPSIGVTPMVTAGGAGISLVIGGLP